MKKMITVLTLAAALFITGFSQEDPSPARHGKQFFEGENFPFPAKFKEKMMNLGREKNYCHNRLGLSHRMLEELELSKDQAEKVEQIKIRYKKMNIDIDAEKEKLKIDKHQAMKNLNFSEAKNVVKKISDVRLKGQNARIDEMSEIVKILNKEQNEKLKELISAPGGKGHKKMHRPK